MLYQSPYFVQDLFQACAFLGCSATAGYLWKQLWRSYHYIADTSTSRVETAAQGLVELHGTGDLLPGILSQGISMGPPSLWQSYTLSKGDRVIDSGISTAPFQLQDSSGTCVVYPEGATIISSSRATPRQGEKRASIRYLRPGADIYILGDFRTVGGDNDSYDLEIETRNVLRLWKENQRQLITDYDTDSDGRIDAEEWEAVRDKAREAAKSNIKRKRFETQVVHEIRKPSNGLPLIISDKDPVYLEKRFYWLALANLSLAVFCFVVGASKFN